MTAWGRQTSEIRESLSSTGASQKEAIASESACKSSFSRCCLLALPKRRRFYSKPLSLASEAVRVVSLVS